MKHLPDLFPVVQSRIVAPVLIAMGPPWPVTQMIAGLRAPNGDGVALRWLLVLVCVTLAARLVLAATVGLGVDEAYTVATARSWALSTFKKT